MEKIKKVKKVLKKLKNNSMDKIYLVFYLGVKNFKDYKYDEIMDKYKDLIRRMEHENHDLITITIPDMDSHNTRVECINPKLISKEEYSKISDIIERSTKLLDDFEKKL